MPFILILIAVYLSYLLLLCSFRKAKKHNLKAMSYEVEEDKTPEVKDEDVEVKQYEAFEEAIKEIGLEKSKK